MVGSAGPPRANSASASRRSSGQAYDPGRARGAGSRVTSATWAASARRRAAVRQPCARHRRSSVSVSSRPSRRIWYSGEAWRSHSRTVTPYVSGSATVRPRVRSAQIAQTQWFVEVGMGRVCPSRTYVSGTRCVEFVPDLRTQRANRQPPAAVHVSLAIGPRQLRRGPARGVRTNWRTPPMSIARRSHPTPMPTTPHRPAARHPHTGCGRPRGEATLRP